MGRIFGKFRFEIRRGGLVNIIGNPWFIWVLPDWFVGLARKAKTLGGKG